MGNLLIGKILPVTFFSCSEEAILTMKTRFCNMKYHAGRRIGHVQCTLYNYADFSYIQKGLDTEEDRPMTET